MRRTSDAASPGARASGHRPLRTRTAARVTYASPGPRRGLSALLTWSRTSAAASLPCCPTDCAASFAASRTASAPSFAGSLRSCTTSCAVDFTSSTSGAAFSLTPTAARCSARLDGRREATTSPTPKATRPTARGCPASARAPPAGGAHGVGDRGRRAARRVGDRRGRLAPAVGDAVRRVPGRVDRVVGAAHDAVLTLVTPDRTRSTWRRATLPGLTFSPRASTSRLSSVRVRSMSARISSGSLVLMSSSPRVLGRRSGSS